MRKTAFAAALCLLAGAGVARAASQESAAIEVSGTNGVRIFALGGSTFALSWVHSVERTEWKETFRVGVCGDLRLVESEYASAGAGLPDSLAPGETFELRGGRMVISNRSLSLPELRVRLSEVSHHVLWLDGAPVDLTEIFGEGPVVIRAQPRDKERAHEEK